MAKRKKHHKKRIKHKTNVAKSTTIKPAKPANVSKKEPIQADKTESLQDIKLQKNDWELKDVKYSLMVFGLIIIAFAALYFVLQNNSVSNYFYGFIKITK